MLCTRRRALRFHELSHLICQQLQAWERLPDTPILWTMKPSLKEIVSTGPHCNRHTGTSSHKLVWEPTLVPWSQPQRNPLWWRAAVTGNQPQPLPQEPGVNHVPPAHHRFRSKKKSLGKIDSKMHLLSNRPPTQELRSCLFKIYIAIYSW